MSTCRIKMKAMTKHLHIKTFGCQMNERDSEIMEQLLAQHGYLAGADAEQADLIILNTCSIRAKAEQKFFSLLGSLRQEKRRRPGLLAPPKHDLGSAWRNGPQRAASAEKGIEFNSKNNIMP